MFGPHDMNGLRQKSDHTVQLSVVAKKPQRSRSEPLFALERWGALSLTEEPPRSGVRDLSTTTTKSEVFRMVRLDLNYERRC